MSEERDDLLRVYGAGKAVGGNITITGNDAYGNPVSETILVQPRKRLSFNTWKRDYLSFAVDLTIEPGYWITFMVHVGRRVLKWEYLMKRRNEQAI